MDWLPEKIIPDFTMVEGVLDLICAPYSKTWTTNWTSSQQHHN